jgi:hypothetical protein
VVEFDPKLSKFYDPALSSTCVAALSSVYFCNTASRYKYVADEPFHLAYGDGTVLNGHR